MERMGHDSSARVEHNGLFPLLLAASPAIHHPDVARRSRSHPPCEALRRTVSRLVRQRISPPCGSRRVLRYRGIPEASNLPRAGNSSSKEMHMHKIVRSPLVGIKFRPRNLALEAHVALPTPARRPTPEFRACPRALRLALRGRSSAWQSRPPRHHAGVAGGSGRRSTRSTWTTRAPALRHQPGRLLRRSAATRRSWPRARLAPAGANSTGDPRRAWDRPPSSVSVTRHSDITTSLPKK